MERDTLMDRDTLMQIAPPVYELFKPYLNMSQRRAELRKLLDDLRDLNIDLDNQARNQEQRPQTRRRQEVATYIRTSNVLVDGATRVLDECEEGGVFIKHVRCVTSVPSIEQYLCEAKELVDRGRSWLENVLSYNDVKGDKLPVRDLELMGKTAREKLDSALVAVTTGQKYTIGIYGCPGAGKKSLMKHIYNRVLKDHPDFKAVHVFWAEAPENPRDDYALQEKVSEGMWFDIRHDIDCVRRSSFLEERFNEMAASGRVILFLCNLREEFRAYEVLGISARNCVLVFTAPSLDVCNRMKCDMIIKVDHLPREEAEELFMREAGLDDHHRQEIKDVASQIANECARMPLAIRVIANSMREINDIHEWRNRLTELLGRISSINNEEDKILEQLKFGYTCLEDPTTRSCFNVAAKILANDAQLPKATVIAKWRECKLIGNGWHSDDQGHTMLNQLERLCLLELEPANQLVTMNKWIRKIAAVL